MIILFIRQLFILSKFAFYIFFMVLSLSRNEPVDLKSQDTESEIKVCVFSCFMASIRVHASYILLA